MKREAVPDYGATEDECRAYFSACAALRENRGHVDLLRGQHYRKRAQFFALYDDVRALPPNTASFASDSAAKFIMPEVEPT